MGRSCCARFDSEYNRFRYYDPDIGRYISADPIGQLGGHNLYRYALNNPTGAIDPDGRIVGVLGGAAVVLSGAVAVAIGGSELAFAASDALDFLAGLFGGKGGGDDPCDPSSEEGEDDPSISAESRADFRNALSQAGAGINAVALASAGASTVVPAAVAAAQGDPVAAAAIAGTVGDVVVPGPPSTPGGAFFQAAARALGAID